MLNSLEMAYFATLFSFVGVWLWLYAIIHDFMYDVELVGIPVWCVNILIWPIGIARGLILTLR